MASKNQIAEDVQSFEQPDSDLPPLPIEDDDSYLNTRSQSGLVSTEQEGSVLTEREMQKRLMDIESSFMPEEPVASKARAPAGLDDTFVFGAPLKSDHQPQMNWPLSDELGDDEDQKRLSQTGSEPDENVMPQSPPTPADAYKTPAARLAKDLPNDPAFGDTPDCEEGASTSENIPSSPLAAAVRRQVSKVSADEYTANEPDTPRVASASESQRAASRASTVKPNEPSIEQDSSGIDEDDATFSMADISTSRSSSNISSLRVNKRPSYLGNRISSQRSSQSSITNRSDVSGEGISEGTLGADYALQSGAAVSGMQFQGQGQNGASMTLSRLPSLGSIASSVSGVGQGEFPWGNSQNKQTQQPLPTYRDASHSILANSILANSIFANEDQAKAEQEPLKTSSDAVQPFSLSTPRPSTHNQQGKLHRAPTDTVIAKQVQSIHVPVDTAREYQRRQAQQLQVNNNKDASKMESPTPSQYRNPLPASLGLREQNTRIDSLSKENFDLKLKVFFLKETLSKRSDENVDEMIEHNVRLQSELVLHQKEVSSLRKLVKTLEKKLSAKEEGIHTSRPSTRDSDVNSQISETTQRIDDEVVYLHERVETLEQTIEHLREEGQEKEKHRRRMAELIKAMGNRSLDTESANLDEEARQEWSDLVEAGVARQNALEQEADALRARNEELEQSLMATKVLAARSRSSSNGSLDKYPRTVPQSLLLDKAKKENVELRRDLSAQASMLTSRNRERERLQNEIEELKRQARRGDGNRSVTGDSILERSVSRAFDRPSSQDTASSQTAATLTEKERDEYENKHTRVRNELLQIRMLNQDLEKALNEQLDILGETEEENQALLKEKDLTLKDLQDLNQERDDLLQALDQKEADYEGLRAEALQEIRVLEEKLDSSERQCNRLDRDLGMRNEDFNALQEELKHVSSRVVQLEDDHTSKIRRIQTLDREILEANQELESLDEKLRESNHKLQRVEIQLESTQSEITFLREEQEGDKIKIGELGVSLATAEASLKEEIERVQDIQKQHADEAKQRELIETKEKSEVQKFVDDLNGQVSKVKDENRKLRKSLSTKEVEANGWKGRLNDLEANLREVLGSLDGTKSSWLKEITKMQKDLDSTVQELDSAKTHLAEKDRLLRTRDSLLESAGLESRRLSDLLEKERQARKQDRAQHEQSQRNQHNVIRTNQQSETRISELEKIRVQDRRKIASLETQYRDQLLERNNLLLALWNRLSTLCGAEWARQNSLVNGELPSIEVISRNLPGFNKNIILAVKTVETLIGGFRTRVRGIERELYKDYQTLEHTLDIRSKRIDHLERIVLGSTGTKILKATPSRSSVAASLLRHHSAGVVETTKTATTDADQRWIYRLKELESRLKAEREARLLDRSGARKRIIEEQTEKAELKMALEKEKERRLAQ